MRLPTSGGHIEVGEGAGKCDGACGASGGGMAALDVVVRGERRPRILCCGDCLSAALAIMYGRAHVKSGGRVEDLKL